MTLCTYGVSVGKQCEREATMAVRTTSNSKGLVTTAYWDDTDAPKVAQRLCGTHGGELLSELAKSVGS